jgi:hypothetical protein
MRATNLALRFLLELCLLAALAVWGAQAGGSVVADVALPGLAPVPAAAVWGMFVAPRAPGVRPGAAGPRAAAVRPGRGGADRRRAVRAGSRAGDRRPSSCAPGRWRRTAAS